MNSCSYTNHQNRNHNEAPRGIPPPRPWWQHLALCCRRQGKRSTHASLYRCLNLTLQQAVLESVGIEADSDRLDKLISELEGKDINELIQSGSEKLASVPSGGSGSAAASGGAAAAGGSAEAEAAPEAAKEEEKEESDDDMGFGLFD